MNNYYPVAPCKDCNDRTEGCHSVCPYYKVYKLRKEEINKKIKAEEMKYYRPGGGRMTKDELKEIPRIEKRIRQKQEQIEILKALEISVPALNSSEKVQSTVVNRSMDQTVKRLDLEDMLHEDCTRLLRLKDEAYSLIRGLSGAERELMELRYISGYTWERIAVEMSYSYRHIVRLHGKILQKLY